MRVERGDDSIRPRPGARPCVGIRLQTGDAMLLKLWQPSASKRTGLQQVVNDPFEHVEMR